MNGRATSSPREAVPDFSKMAFRWSCTVSADTCGRSAISFVENPGVTPAADGTWGIVLDDPMTPA